MWTRSFSSHPTKPLLPSIKNLLHQAKTVQNKVKPESSSSLPFTVDSAEVEANVKFLTKVDGSTKIAKLAHGLDRVLFNPGVHLVKDWHSQVYNFDPHLEQIPSSSEFDHRFIPQFVSAGDDKMLHELAQQHQIPVISSTSSITGWMSHLFQTMTGRQGPNLQHLSRQTLEAIPIETQSKFTLRSRAPLSVRLRRIPSTSSVPLFAVVADKNGADTTVLSEMGHILERMLTTSPQVFRSMLQSQSTSTTVPTSTYDAYQYMVYNGSLMIRSQLDCFDERLPRKTFDIKTRAILPVRMDNENYESYSGYPLNALRGKYASYEREMLDMSRSILLKYFYQVSLGQMDGILLAHHNCKQIFGFQYMTLADMAEQLLESKRADYPLQRQDYLALAEKIFQFTTHLLNILIQKCIESLPKELPGEWRIIIASQPEHHEMTVFMEHVDCCGRRILETPLKCFQLKAQLSSSRQLKYDMKSIPVKETVYQSMRNHVLLDTMDHARMFVNSHQQLPSLLIPALVEASTCRMNEAIFERGNHDTLWMRFKKASSHLSLPPRQELKVPFIHELQKMKLLEKSESSNKKPVIAEWAKLGQANHGKDQLKQSVHVLSDDDESIE